MKIIEKEQDQWDLFLDAVFFSYRVSRQDSTRFSPFYLVYGRNAHLPIEFNARESDSEEDEESPLGLKDTNLDERTERMILFRKKHLKILGEHRNARNSTMTVSIPKTKQITELEL